MKKPILGGFFAIASLAFFPYTSIAGEAPKLILQITVDQLRSDLPKRYMSKMGEGGFKYLYDQGIVYEDAHHAHSNTETIVGHTTLATGAYPAQGMGL